MSGGTAKKILLVEDEAIIALAERMTLESYGFEVVTALTGEDAVAIVGERRRIDLVLMDIDLGRGMDGTDAARLILRDHNLPLIFLSSHTERAIVEKTEGITSYGYILKNSGETVLIASIRMAFRLFEAKSREEEKERILHRNEEWLRLANEAADLGVWRHDLALGRVTLDERARRHFGIASEEVSLEDVLAVVHPSDADRLRREVAMVTAPESGGTFATEYRVVHGDGEVRWLSVHAQIHFEGEGSARRATAGFGTTQDITERKRTEEKLAHSHELMRYIIDHSRSAIAVHDRELRYLYVSRRYLQEYGVAEQDVIGRHHYEVFPDLPQKWRDVHRRALAGEISSAEDDPFVRDDGTVLRTRWECRPWYEADGSIGGIVVYTEVLKDPVPARHGNV